MARNPTTAELNTIRRLIKSAGGDAELRRWIRLAYTRRRGRPLGSTPFHEYDERVVNVAELLHLWSRRKLSLHAAIKKIIAGERLQWTRDRGASPDATIKRLLRKAQDQLAIDGQPLTDDELRKIPNLLQEIDVLLPGAGTFFAELIMRDIRSH